MQKYIKLYIKQAQIKDFLRKSLKGKNLCGHELPVRHIRDERKDFALRFYSFSELKFRANVFAVVSLFVVSVGNDVQWAGNEAMPMQASNFGCQFRADSA